MKLYASIKSERASEGQGGNEFIEIEVTNQERKRFLHIKITPDDSRYKVIMNMDKNLCNMESSDGVKCICVDPLCAKCLLVNCQDLNCAIHSENKKAESRIMYKNR